MERIQFRDFRLYCVRVFNTVLLLSCTMLFVGCSRSVKEYSVDEIAGIIETDLTQKYNESFEVLEVEEINEGQNFADYVYCAIATNGAIGRDFNVRIEPDGSGMMDNFEGILYSEEIEGDVNSIIASITDISTEKLTVTYLLSDMKSSSLKEYLQQGNVMVQAELRIKGEEPIRLRKTVYKLIESLQQKKYGFSLKIDFNNKTVIFYHNGYDDEITEDAITEKMG